MGDDQPMVFEPDPVIEAYKKDVDRTLLQESLRLTPDQRVRRMIQALQVANALRASVEKARGR